MNFSRVYLRHHRFVAEDIFQMFGRPPESKKKSIHLLNDQFTTVNMLRLRVLVASNCMCVACGARLTHFWQEAHMEDRNVRLWKSPPPLFVGGGFKYHLNAYATNSNGHESMLTIDHIKPRSHGGVNKETNMTTLCWTCNGKKGADLNWLRDLPRNTRGLLVPRPHLQNHNDRKHQSQTRS